MQIVATANDVGARPAQRPAANQLEAAFLEEMLKYCGPSARSGAFGGGAGEEQFSSYLDSGICRNSGGEAGSGPVLVG